MNTLVTGLARHYDKLTAWERCPSSWPRSNAATTPKRIA